MNSHALDLECATIACEQGGVGTRFGTHLRALPQCQELQIIGSGKAATTSLEIQELLQAIGRAGNRSRQAKFRHVVGKYAVDDVKLRGR